MHYVWAYATAPVVWHANPIRSNVLRTYYVRSAIPQHERELATPCASTSRVDALPFASSSIFLTFYLNIELFVPTYQTLSYRFSLLSRSLILNDGSLSLESSLPLFIPILTPFFFSFCHLHDRNDE